jgi:DNA invertase Pin-like site-specific DNA recombinase
MLTMLGGLAEFERDLIRAHTGGGREPAKARGAKLGRKTKIHRTLEARDPWSPRPRHHDEEGLREIARSYDLLQSPISRLTK